MALDRLTEQEVQTALDAIAQIVPVLDLQDCLKIMQWATERAAEAQMPPVMPAAAPTLSLVSDIASSDMSDNTVNAVADELEDELPPMLNLDLSNLDLGIAPPSIEKPDGDNFLVPTLELVGEPPEDLPLAM